MVYITKGEAKNADGIAFWYKNETYQQKEIAKIQNGNLYYFLIHT